MDETGMAYEHRPLKVVTLKGQKKIKCRTSGNKTQTTVVACINAVGQAIPPYVIYNAKTLNPRWMENGVAGARYARSENGWIDTELFKIWLKYHFLQYAVSNRPLLLILDGHKTHYNLEVCEYAKEQGVIMFCLPPHSTHVSQPLDTCVFKPLKSEWNKVAHNFQAKNPGARISKYNFPSLLKEAWEKAMISSNICVGFRNSGIYPFDPDKIRPTIENMESETDTDHDDSNDEIGGRNMELHEFDPTLR
ncbi:uncharacterized protein [Dysidea avara]|uniref:uncharacterized protein n=1 Tax=Dysidea avara TaxID=196820 RepID=UPI00331D4EC2